MHETVYRHRYCGCPRGILIDEDADLHRLLTAGEGMVFERRPLSRVGFGPAYREMQCEHELKMLHVAPWARVPPVESECLRDDGSALFSSYRGELTRVGVMSSRVRMGISINLPALGAARKIKEAFSLEMGFDPVAVRSADSDTVDSYGVCAELGLVLVGRVVEALTLRNSDAAPPGLSQAVDLVGMLLDSRSDPQPLDDEAPSVLCFAYGAAALLAMGVERRLVSYWAFRYSQDNPRLGAFGISVSSSLRSEMRYLGLMEHVLGTDSFEKFQQSSSSMERTFLTSEMARSLLSYLTH